MRTIEKSVNKAIKEYNENPNEVTFLRMRTTVTTHLKYEGLDLEIISERIRHTNGVKQLRETVCMNFLGDFFNVYHVFDNKGCVYFTSDYSKALKELME